jgi:hypothetical protein
MANIEMNVLKVGDSEFEIADAKARQDCSDLKDDLTAAQVELAKKANTDGYYEDMTVGDAEQLVSTVYTENSVPYNFRPTAGDGDRAYVDAVVGGTVCLNQLVENGNFASASGWNDNGNVSLSVANNIATMTTTIASGDRNFSRNINKPSPTGHKLFVSVDMKVSEASTPQAGVYGVYARKSLSANTWETCSVVGNVTSTASLGYAVVYAGNMALGGTVDVKNFYAVDLTVMFGSTIADYIYSLETATEGAGVAWLKEHFPKIFNAGYIPYNPGELVSVSGVSEKRNIGFNQWDEQWEVGGIDHSTGQNNSANTVIRSKNYIPCLPGTTYFFANLSNAGSPYIHYYDASKNFVNYEEATRNTTFTTPSGVYYIRFNMDTGYGVAYKNDICINLHWDGERDGEYEPYVEHSYPLDSSIVLRGIPKLDSANNLYYDGDTYESDGTVTRRYGIVDLGTLGWSRYNFGGTYVFYVNLPDKLSGYLADGICSKYVVGPQTSPANLADKQMDVKNNQTYIYVRDDSHTTETDFINAVTGSYLVYTLATPTTETAEPYQQRQIIDADGTEEFVSTSVVPVGHITKYPENLRKKIEGLPWNFASLIAPTEAAFVATRNYTTGSLFIVNNVLYKATANIANGATITPNSNCTATTLAEVISALS